MWGYTWGRRKFWLVSLFPVWGRGEKPYIKISPGALLLRFSVASWGPLQFSFDLRDWSAGYTYSCQCICKRVANDRSLVVVHDVLSRAFLDPRIDPLENTDFHNWYCIIPCAPCFYCRVWKNIFPLQTVSENAIRCTTTYYIVYSLYTKCYSLHTILQCLHIDERMRLKKAMDLR